MLRDLRVFIPKSCSHYKTRRTGLDGPSTGIIYRSSSVTTRRSRGPEETYRIVVERSDVIVHVRASLGLVERRVRLAALAHARPRLARARAQRVTAARNRTVIGRRVRPFRVSGPQRVVDHASARGRRFGRVHRTLVVGRGGRPSAGQQQKHQRPPRERAALGGGLAAHIVSGEFVQSVVMPYGRHAERTAKNKRRGGWRSPRRTFVFARRENRRLVWCARPYRSRASTEIVERRCVGVTFSVMCAPRGPRHLRGAGTDPAIGRSPGTTICRAAVSTVRSVIFVSPPPTTAPSSARWRPR